MKTSYFLHKTTYFFYIRLLFLITILFFVSGCDTTEITGVRSPDPGTIRIFLKADDSDNFIVVAGDTATVGQGVNDSLALVIGQARAFVDEKYAVIFQTLDEYRELSDTLNILTQENNTYKRFKIFESFVPPDTYDSLGIVISATFVQVGSFQIPIEMPEDTKTLKVFDNSFQIKEDKITEIYLKIKPFESMTRFGDTFQFQRIITIESIKIL